MSITSKATIGDFVWVDANGNGLQDTSEVGLSGVTIQLKDKNGKVVQTTTTDSKGNYIFSAAAGTYSLTIVAPTGYKLTSQDAQSDACDSKDSDFNTTSFSTAKFTVSSGQLKNNLDAGLIKISGTPGSAPTVTLSTDSNNDGYINAAELGNATSVSVKIAFPTGAVAGDKLTLTDGGTPRVLTLSASDISTGYVITSVSKPAEGATLNVSATFTNSSGVESAKGCDTAVLDTLGFSRSPIVTITTDANNDGIVTASELGNASSFAVKIDLPAEVKLGDQINLNAGGVISTRSLTATEISSRVLNTSVPKPAEGASVSVKVYVTDAAGNRSAEGSDSAQLNSGTPSKPSVSISTDSNNDGILSPTEINGANFVDVAVTLPTSSQLGDTVSIVNQFGQSVSKIVDANDLAAQKINFPGVYWIGTPGSRIDVSATITDTKGNVSPAGTDSVVIGSGGSSKPGTPVVSISTDLNNDGYLNANELGNAPKVDVKVSLPTDAKAGQTVTLTDGSTPIIYTLTPSDISNGYWLGQLPRPAEGQTLTASATLTDPVSGTSAPGTDRATVDTQPTAKPVVEILTDANNDGIISAPELGSATQLSVKVTLPTGTKPGDLLTLNDGLNAPQTRPLTAQELSNGFVLANVPKPQEGVPLTVSAIVTDAAGNPSAPGQDTAVLNSGSKPSTPLVSISTDLNNDGYLNANELGNASKVDVKVSLPTDAKAGQTVTLTDGSTPIVYTLTPSDISNGYWLGQLPRPAEGQTLTASATLTDPVTGTSAPGTDRATVDTQPTAKPVVEILTDANNDGIVSAPELGSATQLSVKVTLPTGTKPGDLLTLNDGLNAPQTRPLTAQELSNGFVLANVPKPQEGVPLTVSAIVTDAAGNPSAPGQDTAVLNTANVPLPTPAVTIQADSNNDGYLNAQELNGASTIQVQVTIPNGAKVGQVMTFSDGKTSSSNTLDQSDLDSGVWTLFVAKPAEGQILNVNAVLSDPASGAKSVLATDSAIIDTTASNAPTVTIRSDSNNDGVITSAELANSPNQIQVNVLPPSNAKVGDLLTVTDGSIPQTHTLTANDLSTGWNTTVTKPAEGKQLVVSATVTDPAGNTSALGQDSALIKTAAPTPTVSIVDDSNNDGKLSAIERGTSTAADVKVDLPQGAQVGDKLELSDNAGNGYSRVLSSTDLSTGSVLFPNVFPIPAANTTLEVSARLIDKTGNTSPTTTDSVSIDPNHAPVNSGGAVSGSGIEDAPATQINLLANTTDADQDPLSISNLSYSINGTASSIPDGISVKGNTLSVDTTNPYFDQLAAGEKQTLGASYTISDDKGASVAQTANVVITGVNDAPVLTSSTANVLQGVGATNTVSTVTSSSSTGFFIPLTATYGSQTVVSNSVNISGLVGRVVDSGKWGNGFLVGDTNQSGTLNMAFAKPVYDLRIAWTGQSSNEFFGYDEDVSFVLNGQPVKLNADSFVAAIPWSLQISADGLHVDSLGDSGGVYTLHSDIPINTFAINNTVISGSPNGSVFTIEMRDSMTVKNTTTTLTPSSGVNLASLMPTVSDIDHNASIKGWAITQAKGDIEGNHWQYSLDGQQWLNLDSASASAAFFLNPSDKIRWTGVDGTYTKLAAVAVDNTESSAFDTGAAGHLNVSTRGDTTPYSTAQVVIGSNSVKGISGVEDTALPLKWADFGNTGSALIISSLPTDGQLQYLSGSNWLSATQGQTVSKSDIDGGKLRFMPDANESGFDAYKAPGVGNKLNDYAKIGFSLLDSNNQPIDSYSLPIDIAPHVDSGNLGVAVKFISSNSLGDCVPDDQGYVWPWQKYQTFGFYTTGASPDTDGSERLTVGMHLSTPRDVFLSDGSKVVPDAYGTYYVPVNKPVWIEYGNAWAGRFNLYNDEVDSAGNILDRVTIAPSEPLVSDIYGMTFDLAQVSPLALDLNGDGLHTTTLAGGVQFDLNDTGAPIQTAWIAPDDGLLALDINGNGQIDSGAELFGTATNLADSSKANDGFQALAQLDSNHDGQVDMNDPLFAKLLVWQDRNTDGVSTSDELFSLSALNIATLDVNAQKTDTVQNGNTFGLSASFTDTAGQSHDLIDVWFSTLVGATMEVQASPEQAPEVALVGNPMYHPELLVA